MMSEAVRAVLCGEVATLSFNRPSAYNAFDLGTISVFSEHLINLAADTTVRAVIITGEGKVFCSGGDLKWVYGWPDGYPAAFHNLAARLHQAIIEIRRMPKPVIAAINGVAAGAGFSLALACDFRVMEKSAVLRQAYTSKGLAINGGGTFILPRLVGLARALEIAVFDPVISADQALKWGLATRVVKDGNALEESFTLAKELCRRPMHALAQCKQLFMDSFHTSFETQLERERLALTQCAGSAEGTEGLNAFFEKRDPQF
jgi:2-(1,2-epoxy-1,2-dihydrophenyl)acetyl-CoA isomerase